MCCFTPAACRVLVFASNLAEFLLAVNRLSPTLSGHFEKYFLAWVFAASLVKLLGTARGWRWEALGAVLLEAAQLGLILGVTERTTFDLVFFPCLAVAQSVLHLVHFLVWDAGAPIPPPKADLVVVVLTTLASCALLPLFFVPPGSRFDTPAFPYLFVVALR